MKKILTFSICLFLSFVCIHAQEKDLQDICLANESFNKDLSKWMDCFELTIDDFNFVSSQNFSLEGDSSSIYHRDFGEGELHYDPILNHYSPNERRYVELLPTKGVWYDEETEEYRYIGGDDCEEIYYVDLDTKNTIMIQWNGSSQNTSDVFWVNSDTFGLVSVDNSDRICIVALYTIANDRNEARYQVYEAPMKLANPKVYDVVFKERNIKYE